MTRAAACLAAVLWCSAAPRAEEAAPSAAERVRALVASDRFEEALEIGALEAAAAPNDADLTAALGEALLRAGRIEEAGARVEPLLASESPPARAMMVAGLVRSASGRTSEASDWLDRAARAAPADPEVLFRASDGVAESKRAVELLEAFLAGGAGGDADRIASAKGSLAFHRALGEREVWIRETRPERVDVKLRPLGGGGVVSGFVLQARLGSGKSVPLLLDTGSTGLFLVERIAKRHGFQELAIETTFGGGSGERHRTRRGLLPSFAVGDLRFRDVLATVSDVELDPTGRYAGVIGIQPFAGYRIVLDLTTGSLTLDSSRAGDSGGADYWTVAGQMLVSAGVTSGPAGLFLLDTGATRSLVSQRFAAKVPGARVTGEASVRGYGGDVRGARTVRGVRVEFLSAQTSGEPMAAIDLDLRSRMGGVEVCGYLGLDLLAEGGWVIDPDRRKVRRLPARQGRGHERN